MMLTLRFMMIARMVNRVMVVAVVFLFGGILSKRTLI